MRQIAFLLTLLSACLLLVVPSSAFILHGGGNPQGASPVACMTYTSQLANDGCLAANQNALFTTNVFTTMRQSGQTFYAGGHVATYNIPALDYPVGQITPDGSMQNPTTASLPAGCTYISANNFIRCNQSGHSGGSFTSFFFNDVGFYDGAAGGNFTFNDIHARVGVNSCRSFSGVAFFRAGAITSITNATFDVDETVCSPYAYLFGQTGDPGLTVNSTGTANVSGSSLTYSGTPTGTVRAFQYVSIPGGSDAIITAWNAGTLTATLCNNPTYPSNLTPSCSGSQPTLTGVTVTTGPVQATYGASSAISGVGTWKYNAIIGYSTCFQSGANTDGNSNTAEFNYCDIISPPTYHNQFLVWLANTTAGNSATLSADVNFNVSFYDKLSFWNTGTGNFAIFGNGQTAAAQVTWDHISTEFNIAGGNNCITGSFGCVSPFQTYNTLIRLTKQFSANGVPVHYTLTGGVLTIVSVDGAGTLQVGSTVECSGSLGGFGCQSPIRITAFGGSGCGGTCTGSGGTGTYPVVNTTSVVSTSTASTAYPYQGIINNYNAIGNFMDDTGSNGGMFNIEVGDFWVKASDFSSTQNTNLLTGVACTPTSC